MQFGLQENIIRDIQTVFSAFPEVEEAVLYGSRAKGNYKPGSDIDLTLKGDNLNYSLLNLIRLKLDDLYLPYTFDLSVFLKLSDIGLINNVNRTGISFYRRNVGDS
jgi:predicted nucleotidyltransferase